ncbi:hypothetical protein BDU57DRAFT_578937 [Ampelomyces quisqualis]|uniref:Uncharacterized protein n=1 Tax=Ampelomyces quisqualis TaxID=50730 RepID=A0A6A5QGA6_AMPQU|nr:hypothetical protein BDU57DRAFT_578937 [Ampelomyces quisqualis]
MDRNMRHAPFTSDRARRARANETREMRQWAERLELTTQVPQDILHLMAREDGKQMEIMMKNMGLDGKATTDAEGGGEGGKGLEEGMRDMKLESEAMNGTMEKTQG